MASSPDTFASFQSIPQKTDILRRAFGDLETHKNLIARCLQGWDALDQHIAEIRTALEARYVEMLDRERNLETQMKFLEEKEASLEAKMQEREAALDKRESLIESREHASLARVQEQKEAAVAAIREQKRKWMEERLLLQSQSSARTEESAPNSKLTNDQCAPTIEDHPTKSCSETNNCSSTKSQINDPSIRENVRGCVASSSKPNGELKATPMATGQLGPTIRSHNHEKVKSVQTCIDSSPKPTTKAFTLFGLTTLMHDHEMLKDESKPIPQVNTQHAPIVASHNRGRDPRTMSGERKVDMSLEFDVSKVKLEPDAESEKALTNHIIQQLKQTNDAAGGPKLDKETYCNGHQAIDGGEERSEEEGDENHRHDDPNVYLNKGLNSIPYVEPRPQLKLLCEKMDALGLCSFITMQKKDMPFVRRELPFALKFAPDPIGLVLMAVEGYYSAGQGSEICPTKLAIRKTCISLMEALVCLLVDGSVIITSSIQEEAKRVADQWKVNINPNGTDQVSLMDAQCFLQILATFNLTNHYSQDELCDIVAPICNRRNVPALWRDLGMATKSPDVVDRLIKSGKQLEAVAFIHEFQLCQRFPPVPLLKAYLKDIRKLQSNKNSSEDQNQLLTKELYAVKEVIKCIQKYKLETYPTDGLQKRVLQLEKRNPDKKRNSETTPCGGKKMRTSNGPGACTTPVTPHNGQFRISEKSHFNGRGVGPRNPYSSPFRGIGRADVYLTYSGGRSSYGTPPFPHSNYQYSGGPPSSYHGSYLHR